MPVLGLTGNLAAGKSTVLRLLKQKGAKVFDADRVIHGYYRNKRSPVFKKVKAEFPECLSRGVISRKKLGSVVFSDNKRLRKLERIVHPAVIVSLLQWVKKAGPDRKKIYIAEVPLLFEKKLIRHFDRVILIRVKREVLTGRIIKKYGFSRKRALSRLSLYRPVREKIKGSDFIVDNSLNFRRLKKEVDLLWKKIK